MKNENLKIISRKNLLSNLDYFSRYEICLMVKGDAYGHGVKNIVSTCENKVAMFGVATLCEAVALRKITTKRVVLFSKTNDFATCQKYGIEFFIEDKKSLESAIYYGCKNLVHLAINSGMNRYGTSNQTALREINKLLYKYNVALRSIYTHFPNLENKKITIAQHERFLKMKKEVAQNCKVCLGGSLVSNYGFPCDIIRVGIGVYGYELGTLPVMKIVSYVAKINYVKKGERVGYGEAFTMQKDGFVAVVPVGYYDGLPRALSHNFEVKIGQKLYPIIGSICMDCFFVLVDSFVKVDAKVIVLEDAQIIAEKLGTISYEVLTNFSTFRGKTLIE